MGGLLSTAASEPPPAVVLVPPLIDVRDRGRSRFAKSAYDCAFGQPELRALFDDYVVPRDLRGVLRFTPPDDPRVSVAATLTAPAPLGGGKGLSSGGGGAPPPATGAVSLRFQPHGDAFPFSFVDFKARAPGAAAARACWVSPALGLGLFAAAPLDGGAPAAAARLGARYASRALSVGAVADARGALAAAWAVARAGPLLLGAQARPEGGAPLRRLLGGGGGGDALRACAAATSFAAAYRPPGGGLTAAVEAHAGGGLTVSFLHHAAIQRRVRNPAESADAVGITSYLDVGVAVGAGAAAPAALALAAAWQVNKNVAVKARAGLDGAAAALVLRSWWQPAATLAVTASTGFGGAPPRVGLYAAAESFSRLRYERSPEGAKMAGGRLTRRHAASREDLALAAGRGALVPLGGGGAEGQGGGGGAAAAGLL